MADKGRGVLVIDIGTECPGCFSGLRGKSEAN